jgi:hypothetical protein
MTGNFLLWLAWALFGSYLVLLLWRRYLPLLREAPAEDPAPEPEPALSAPPAWLFCEEGTALDRRVRWFPLARRGQTVVGAKPRAAAGETEFVYLTAEDIREDHAVVGYDPALARYVLRAVDGGLVLHNNEPLAGPAELADGDTLDLGRLSRFRFTLTGPEN